MYKQKEQLCHGLLINSGTHIAHHTNTQSYKLFPSGKYPSVYAGVKLGTSSDGSMSLTWSTHKPASARVRPAYSTEGTLCFIYIYFFFLAAYKSSFREVSMYDILSLIHASNIFIRNKSAFQVDEFISHLPLCSRILPTDSWMLPVRIHYCS
jgi:hypothetical protein